MTSFTALGCKVADRAAPIDITRPYRSIDEPKVTRFIQLLLINLTKHEPLYNSFTPFARGNSRPDLSTCFTSRISTSVQSIVAYTAYLLQIKQAPQGRLFVRAIPLFITS